MIMSTLKIGNTADLNQVVTVNSGRDGSPIHSGRHELQDSHLYEQRVNSTSSLMELGQTHLHGDTLTGRQLAGIRRRVMSVELAIKSGARRRLTSGCSSR